MVKVLIHILVMFIFSTPVLIRHLWQLKTAVFLHGCLICTVPLNKCIQFQMCCIIKKVSTKYKYSTIFFRPSLIRSSFVDLIFGRMTIHPTNKKWRHDNQNNDTQHNDTWYNQYNDILQNDTQYLLSLTPPI